jgi:hypothetical protein
MSDLDFAIDSPPEPDGAGGFTGISVPPGAPQLNTLTADALKHRKQAEEDRKRAEIKEQELKTRRDAALDTRGTQIAGEGTALKAAETDLAKTMGAQPGPAQMPDPKLPPPVDPKNFGSFAFAMLGLALIGAKSGRGNWDTAAAALNGALKGYKEGSIDKYQQNVAEYKRNYDQAIEKEREAIVQYQQILKSKEHSLNTQLRLIQVHAAAFDHQEMRFAAEQKDVEKVYDIARQYESAADKIDMKQADIYRSLKESGDRLQAQKDRQAAIAALKGDAGAAHGKWMKGPDGTEKFFKTGEIIPADYKEAKEGGAKANQQQASANRRLLIAGNEVRNAVKNIVDLPTDTDTGVFGGRKQGPGLMDATKEAMATKLTAESANNLDIMMDGVDRALAVLSSGGAATGLVGLTEKFKNLRMRFGYTLRTKAHALAEMRQIADSAMEVLLVDPSIAKEQKDLAEKGLNEIRTAIPYTHSQLIQLEKMQDQKPSSTFRDMGIRIQKANEASGQIRKPPMSEEAARTMFNNEKELEQAVAAGKVKPGDKIILNGVPGVWE